MDTSFTNKIHYQQSIVSHCWDASLYIDQLNQTTKNQLTNKNVTNKFAQIIACMYTTQAKLKNARAYHTKSWAEPNNHPFFISYSSLFGEKSCFGIKMKTALVFNYKTYYVNRRIFDCLVSLVVHNPVPTPPEMGSFYAWTSRRVSWRLVTNYTHEYSKLDNHKKPLSKCKKNVQTVSNIQAKILLNLIYFVIHYYWI